jgi:hypothetical protein
MSYPIQDFGVNGQFPATVGGTGSTVKYFGRNVPAAAGANWVAAPATPSSSSPVGAMWVPGDNKLNGQLMLVTATGDFTPASNATSETVTVVIQAVTGSLIAPVYTTLASTGAFTPGVDGIAYNFSIQAELFGSNNSGIVGGTYTAIVNNTVTNGTGSSSTSVVALANSLTGINFNSGNPLLYQAAPFGLVVGITFGASNAANKANLYQFSIEA